MKKWIISFLCAMLIMTSTGAAFCYAQEDKDSTEESTSVSETKAGKSDLFLAVHFVSNWIIGTDDVNVYLDDEEIAVIPHGENYAKLIADVKNGPHRLTFRSEKDPDVRGDRDIDIEGDTTFQCTLLLRSDHVKLDDIELSDNVDLSCIPVPDLKGAILSTAVKDLEKAGFEDIETEAKNDSAWGKKSCIVLDQNLQPGTTADLFTKVVLTCEKTKTYLEDKLLDRSVDEVKAASDELDFAFTFIHAGTDKKINDRIEEMPVEEQKEWVAKEVEPDSLGKRKADITLVCIGDRTVPDVTGLSLSEALSTLKEADFSNIDYESDTGNSVLAANNWAVISQNMKTGKTIAADSDIHLVVKSNKDIEAENENSTAANGDADMANPWSDAESAEEAAEGAGLDSFNLVENLDLGLGVEFERTYRYMDGIAEARLEYPASEVIVRKGKAVEGGDISGDYNTYAHTWTQNIKGLEVTCFGNREGEASKTIWSLDDMCYSITAIGLGGDDDFGLTASALNSIINGLQ